MSIKKEHEQVFTRLYGPNGLANYCNETFKLPPILQSRRALESKLQMRSEKKIVQLSVPHLKSCHEVSQSPTIK